MSATLHSPDAALVERLHSLYHDSSKHSVYQSVPAFMARALGYQEEIHSLWRSDAPRYDYIAERLDLPRGETIADIGANTGFFSLNFAHSRLDLNVAAYELNPRHAEFIELAAAAFELPVEVRSRWCDLEGVGRLPTFGAILLLNVLHHAGFDFDRDLADTNAAFEKHAVKYLTSLRDSTRRLVFQIGSNRGGDKARPVVPRDDDVQRLAWITRTLAKAGWRVAHLGYAQLQSGAIRFMDAVPEVMAAVRANEVSQATVGAHLAALRLEQFPGEFHRRPLVIATANLT